MRKLSPDQLHDIPADRILGLNQDPTSTTYTYTNGVLTSMTEVVGGTNRVSTYNYTNNILTSLVVVHNGETNTTTYTYANGVLTSFTRVTT